MSSLGDIVTTLFPTEKENISFIPLWRVGTLAFKGDFSILDICKVSSIYAFSKYYKTDHAFSSYSFCPEDSLEILGLKSCSATLNFSIMSAMSFLETLKKMYILYNFSSRNL